MAVTTYLTDIWSITDFGNAELGGYAEQQMLTDTRLGVQTLAFLSLMMHLCVSLLLVYRGDVPVYTFLVLGILSLHVMVSASFIREVRTLQVLGMVLLIVSALAVSFLAHRAEDLNIGMIAAVVMLFIAIPIVPWALRESVIVIGLTYFLLTSSLFSIPGKFDTEALWALQLLVLGSTIVVTVITGRNTHIRKQDIRTRFDLEAARQSMELLSMKDHLTGAWNRRYLDAHFPEIAARCRNEQKTLNVAVLDIDDFKGVNDRFGHQLADQILASLGNIFVRHLGDDGCLIRMGGDEFQILYCGDDLEDLIGRAVAELHEDPATLCLAGKRGITLSAGFSSADPDQIADINVLYKVADRALYSDKQQGRAKRSISAANASLGHTGTWRI